MLEMEGTLKLFGKPKEERDGSTLYGLCVESKKEGDLISWRLSNNVN
jgi:hypothetical protein